MVVKNILKNILYRVKSYSLDNNLKFNFFFVFHTEAIYKEEVFNKLILFCKQYYELTGVKVINTIMPFNNPLILHFSKEFKCSEKTYIERINKLSELSIIGYHGHFFENNDITKGIKQNKYDKFQIEKQFEKETRWMKQNIAKFQTIYSAGWWYMNEDILEQLIKHNYHVDFSFTYNPNFLNPFSIKYMKNNKIRFGEAFTSYEGLHHIQTLIGCHNTPFFEDFTRNLNKLLKNSYKKEIIGALCTHDFNLTEDYENTLMCIKKLQKINTVKFKEL